MGNQSNIPRSLMHIAVSLCLLVTCAVGQTYAGELLFFPSVTVTHRSIPLSDSRRDEITPELGIFYTGRYERLRFLAEYLASPDEMDMERLQLGWQLDPAATLWLGRFHNQLGYWDTEFHHNEYLHTSISHPATTFEDEGGPFSTHTSGLMFEGIANHGNAAMDYSLGLGVGPVMAERLEPLDILKPGGHGGKLAVSMKLAYKPQAEGQDQAGVFAGYSRIPVMDRPTNEIIQSLIGAFLNRETERTRLIGEIFLAENHLNGVGASSRSAFASAYLHGEYKIQPMCTIFGRAENTFGARGDPYLNFLPMFVRSRLVAGSHHEIARNQAIKIELSRNERQDDSRYSQVQIQWVMVLP